MAKSRSVVPLHWIVHRRDGNISVMIVRAHSPVHARLKASLDGLEGDLVESHPLESSMAAKIPGAIIGTVMSQDEAPGALKEARMT
jgi:hypothetical protein